MLQARDAGVAGDLRADSAASTASRSTTARARAATASDTATDPAPQNTPEQPGFATDLGDLPVGELSDLVAEHTLTVRRCEATVLTLACAWADRFPATRPNTRLTRRQREAATDLADTFAAGPDPDRSASGDALVGTGGPGTPLVSVFAIAEFAVLRRLPITAGHRLIADALDLRHRLPKLNEHTRSGEIPLWLTRKTATRTRHLTPDQASTVDHWLAQAGPGLSAARFLTLLEAAILEADPAQAAARAEAAAHAQDVWARPDDHGLATVFARIDAGDATLLLATLTRIADILRSQPGGDQLSAGRRRALALGLLARPLQALALLAGQHVDNRHTDGQPGTEHENGQTEPGSSTDSIRPFDWAEPTGWAEQVIDDPREPRPDRPLPPEPIEPDPPEHAGLSSPEQDTREPLPDDLHRARDALGDKGETALTTSPDTFSRSRTSQDMCAPTLATAGDPRPAARDHEPDEPDPPERVVHAPPGPRPPRWSGRYTPSPEDPGQPGGLERDLTALTTGIPAAGMDLARWIRRAWKVGAPKTTLVYHLADIGTADPSTASEQSAVAGRADDNTLQTSTSPPLVRPEHRHAGPLTLDQLTEQLGATAARITVRPVIDPAQTAAVDSYQIPARIRLAVRTRHPASVFPWSACTSPGMDLDHTDPYQPDAPPGTGQTAVDTLGPLARNEHNPKTHGGFAVRQPLPGLHLWRTPTGQHYLVTNTGTTALGRSPAARRLWDAAAPREDARRRRSRSGYRSVMSAVSPRPACLPR